MIRNNKIHFIGIGGIGISAIARMMLVQGKKVSGSDRSFSVITDELKKLGAKIYKGHFGPNLAWDTDLVVYTTAIQPSNPELKRARKLRIPILSYPEMLGLISKDKYTIAVSGSHGKTTTTAMIGKILIEVGLNPTVILGSLFKDSKTNFVSGKSKYLVCEACEYKKAFLNLNPRIIVITNIDNDHLDYYKSLTNIKKAFAEFVEKLNKNDFLVCNVKDRNLKMIIKKTKGKIIDYSKMKTDFKLKIPGIHNVENAKVALVIAKILKISKKKTIKALKAFSGTWRRFDYKGKTKNSILVYDDYAHHPTEIRATLKTAREYFKNKKIWTVFQPHLYSRTKLLLNDFARSFDDADSIIIADIYAAREKKDKRIDSKKLAEKIKKYNKNVLYIKNFAGIEKFLRKNSKKGDMILTMGAGDIFKVGEKMLK